MPFDAIVVLGGGVRAGGELPPWVAKRFDLAMEQAADAPIICCSAGTVHRPNPLDETGRPIFEAVAEARYLLQRGFPPDRIFIECASWDTIGNAYFARTMHTDPAGWRRLLVITSQSHMPRAEAIFHWVFGASPQSGYRLAFLASTDDGLPPEILQARTEREKASLASLEQIAARLPSLADVHRFLFTQHEAYRASLSDPSIARGPVVEAY